MATEKEYREASVLSPLLIIIFFWLYLVVAETAVGNPLSKASEGGRIDMLRKWEGITQSELQQGSGT